MKHQSSRGWKEDKINKIINAIDSRDKILMGAYEVFLLELDQFAENELLDTANRYIKIK
jgi:hypothetical protein